MKIRSSFSWMCAHGLVLFALWAPSPASGQVVKVYENYQERIGSRLTPALQGEDALFGARTNIATGTMSFSVPVLSIPGNNGLDINVSYKLGIRDVGGSSEWYFEEDMPHLSGSFSESAGWTTKNGGSARCSSVNEVGYGPPNVPSSNGRPGTFYRDEYWSGYFLSLPNGGGRLNRFSSGSPSPPTTGGPYEWATDGYWYFSCIPLAVGTGEGFVGHSPDGLKYYFDTMRDGLWIPELWKHNYGGLEIYLERKEIRIYAGKIEDRDGNYIDGLTASDGRSVVRTVSGSTVTYTYGTRQWVVQTSNPFTVTYPDGSTWVANVSGSIYDSGHPITCNNSYRVLTPGTTTATVKSPSGATGIYTLKQALIGYSYVDGQCVPLDDGGSAVDRAAVIITSALVKRVVSGPGLMTQTLDIDYGAANDCYTPSYWSPQCTSTSPTWRTVTHSYSDGRYKRFTIGNRAGVNADLLLKLEEGVGSDLPKRTTETEYSLLPSVGIFAGSLPFSVGEYKRAVLVTRDIVQDGRSFIWQVPSECGGGGASLCVDQYGRPTKVVKVSAP